MYGNHLLRSFAAVFIVGIVMAASSAQAPERGSLTASPMAGKAPLLVTFSGTGSGIMEGVMLLEFGDGQIDNTISPIGGFTRVHSYAVVGAYKAVLKRGAFGGQSPSVLSTVRSLTIIVR